MAGSTNDHRLSILNTPHSRKNARLPNLPDLFPMHRSTQVATNLNNYGGYKVRMPQSREAIRCVLLAVLLSSIGGHSAATDIKKSIPAQPVSAVADTQSIARRQGVANVSGINWACGASRCTTSIMPTAVAAPVAVCQELAREVGVIRSFTVANLALNSKELQQCNSVVPAAAAAPATGVAQQSKSPPGRAADAPSTEIAAPPPLTAGLEKKPTVTKTVNQKTSPYPENWLAPDLPAGKSAVYGDMKNELRKGDQAVTALAKKPPAAKGAPPVSAQGDGISIPQPSPVGTMAPTAPASRSYPVSIRTDTMNVTGTGRLMDRLAYTPKNIRTDAMTVTGTGRVTVNLPFTPKSIRTDGITVTGTGSIR